MGNKKILILGAVPMFLLGCNRMKQITDEKAIEIAGHILERQSKLNNTPPTNFKIVEEYTEIKKATNYDTGKSESKFHQKKTFIMDFDNKKLYEKFEFLAEAQEGWYEGYTFYKEDQNKTYKLNNDNGKKRRKEIEGPNVIETNYSNLITNYVFRASYLETIEDEIKTQKETSEYYKDSKTNKYKYAFYSKDDKSLEEKVDSKIFGRDASNRYDFENTKYIDYRFINDVLEVYQKDVVFDSKYDDDPSVRMKSNYEKTNMKITISYGNNKFDVPSNIDDYVLEE